MENEARRRGLSYRGATSSAEVKQGAYGKVITHKHSKLDQLMRLSEVSAALYVKFVPSAMPNKLVCSNDDQRFCDEKLGQVRRRPLGRPPLTRGLRGAGAYLCTPP